MHYNLFRYCHTHGWFDTHVCTCTGYSEFSEADYFADQAGVYEIRQSNFKESSRVMMQVCPILILARFVENKKLGSTCKMIFNLHVG